MAYILDYETPDEAAVEGQWPIAFAAREFFLVNLGSVPDSGGAPPTEGQVWPRGNPG